ncbi:MAG TPA: hypothetical protein DC058_04980 [Planctomycetaceae bacterium]|jgi:hypothetical protein|nr:hypothetical protein [Planctomycetaceae bacterium]
MLMFRVKFTNSNDAPIFVQVDPWAGLYKLCKGDEIEFAANGNDKELLFDVEEHNDTRIVTLWNSDEYFVVREGRPVHWKEFPTNVSE